MRMGRSPVTGDSDDARSAARQQRFDAILEFRLCSRREIPARRTTTLPRASMR